MNTDSGHTSSPRIEIQVHFATGDRGRKQLKTGPKPREPEPPREAVPRLAQLLALAHHWRRHIEEGVITNYAEIARLMGLSRARVTQIMALLNLAPVIQEQILASPPDPGLEGLTERAVRVLTGHPAWDDQRRLWVSLLT